MDMLFSLPSQGLLDQPSSAVTSAVITDSLSADPLHCDPGDPSTSDPASATVKIEDLSAGVREQILNLIGGDLGIDSTTAGVSYILVLPFLCPFICFLFFPGLFFSLNLL